MAARAGAELIFISHSGRNNDKANQLRAWLITQGWGPGQIYLDLDDLNAGERWRQALNESGAACEAVVVCLSNEWLQSDECKREFNIAETLHKPIFPIYVEPVTLPIPRFITDLQIANIAQPDLQARGFEQLRLGLLKHGIGPRHFAWPPSGEPNRSVFRGLQTFEEIDAAIFFGRDASIGKGLDELRGLRDGANERALVILGASGAGKSSFLRAGLMARLRREDHQFIVLPYIRAELAALSGPYGLMRCLAQAANQPIDIGRGPQAIVEAFATIRQKAIERLRRLSQDESEFAHQKPPTIVVPIDQAEELYQAGNTETARFLELLASALLSDGNAVAVFTIRSNTFELLQRDERLADVPLLPFNLPPIAAGMLGEIVEGPARLARPPIEIEPALTQHLLSEINSPDALPWLSFALERLAIQVGDGKKLTLEQYRTRVGGLNKVIGSVADAAIAPLAREERDQLPWLLRQLVGGPGSREAVGLTLLRMTLDPDVLARHPGSAALIEALISARMLIEDREAGTQWRSIRLAHEAVLRGWDRAHAVVDDYQEYFKQRDALQAQYDAWKAGQGNLLREAPLYQAEALIRQYGEEIQPEVAAYVGDSRSAANRGRNVAYGVAAVMAFLFVLAAAGGLLALREEEIATAALERAERHLQIALDQAAGGIELLVEGYDRGAIASGLLDQLLARSQATMNKLPGETDDVAFARARLLDTMSLANTTVSRAADGRRLAEEAITVTQGLLDKAPGNPQRQRQLAISQERLAEALFWQGDLDGAVKQGRLGKDVLLRLTASGQPDEKLVWELIVAYQRVGDALRAQGNFADATKEYEAWLERAQQLAEREPSNSKWQRALVFAYQRLGETLLAERKAERARALFSEYLTKLKQLESSDPNNAIYLEGLTFAHLRLGDAFLEQGDTKGADGAFQESQEYATKLLEIDPSNFRWGELLIITHQRMGEVRFRGQRFKEALGKFEGYLRLSQKALNKDKSNKAPLYDVSNAHEKVGDALRELGDFRGAFEHHSKQLEAADTLAKQDPSNAGWQRGLAVGHHRLGLVLRIQNNRDQAAFHFRECIRLAPKSTTWTPRSTWPPDLDRECRAQLTEMGVSP